MAQSGKDANERPQFRTLGTKSARRDLARVQPKTASDLDGIGTEYPVYQLGPDLPDTEPVRIYDGVDPAVKEQEKLRAERREASILKAKSKGNYSPADAEDDNARSRRDATRQQIGAKADNFAEAMRRDAAKVARRMEQQRATDERNKPEPSTGSDSMPEPPTQASPAKAPSGGLVDQGMFDKTTGADTRSDEMKARMEFNRLRDLYVRRGARQNVDAQGKPMSFGRFIEVHIAENPDSAIGREYAKNPNGGLFSGVKRVADERNTQEGASRRDKFTDAQESRRIRELNRQTGGVGYLYSNEQDARAAQSQAPVAGNTAGVVSEYMRLGQQATALAQKYQIQHQMYPGMGYDMAAAQKTLEANQFYSLVNRLMENQNTNESAVRIAAGRNDDTPPETTDDRLRSIAESNAPELGINEAATALTPEGSPELYPANKAAVASGVAAQGAVKAVEQMRQTGQPLQPGTAAALAIQQFAATVDKQAFIQRLAPKLQSERLPPRVAAKYLGDVYEALKPQKISFMNNLGRNVGGAFSNIFSQPANPALPGAMQ